MISDFQQSEIEACPSLEAADANFRFSSASEMSSLCRAEGGSGAVSDCERAPPGGEEKWPPHDRFIGGKGNHVHKIWAWYSTVALHFRDIGSESGFTTETSGEKTDWMRTCNMMKRQMGLLMLELSVVICGPNYLAETWIAVKECSMLQTSTMCIPVSG